MEQQEYLIRLSMMEQEAKALEEKMHMIEQQMSEMAAIKASLLEIGGADLKNGDGRGKEILSNLGKGIFIKTEIKGGDLLVNTGKGVVVKKSIGETMQVLDSQIKKLAQGKEQVMQGIEGLQENMRELIEEARLQKKQD